MGWTKPVNQKVAIDESKKATIHGAYTAPGGALQATNDPTRMTVESVKNQIPPSLNVPETDKVKAGDPKTLEGGGNTTPEGR